MNTATIERTKKTTVAKAKVAVPAASTPDSLRATLEQVRATIELAIQSAEVGSAAETLLRHVDESLMSKAADALREPSFSRSDLSAVYESLFVPLAMIEGAIALATGGVIESTLRDAHALLDWAQTEMDDAGPLARSLPDIDPKVCGFMQGKALLAAMFERALASECGGSSSMFSAYRSDTEYVEQVDFVKGDLLRLVADPSLIEGYSAALCEVLSEATLDGITPDRIARASYEECRSLKGAETEQPKQAANPADQRNFCDGRDLAIQMLAAGDALDETDQAEPYRWMRGGAAQNRFTLPFLRRLHAEPALMDGFAAVLSGRLAAGDGIQVDYFALDWAEYQAGPVGADGTATGYEDGPTPPERSAPAIAEPAHVGAVQDACTVVCEARDVLQCRLVELPAPACGAYELLKVACDAFYEAGQSGDVSDCEDASAALFIALEVLQVVSEKAENLVADAALRLATQAKAAIDAEIDQMIRER